MNFEEYLKLNEFAEGTARTRLQEGLHCVLFAVGQSKKNLKSDVWNNTKLLEDSYNKYCSVDAPFGELYSFGETQPSWRESILKATNLLTSSEWLKGKYTYHRNDAYMKSIYDQLQKLAASQGIKISGDKWNPADVWASKGNVSIPNFDNLAQYNKFIYDNLKRGTLIGISLKKISGKGKIVPQSPDEIEEPIKFSKVKNPGGTMFPTGITLMADKAGHGINLRSFRISKQADITGEITISGTGARHGKVPSALLHGMISKYNIPQMPKSRISKMSDKELQNTVISLWLECGYPFSEDKMSKNWEKRKGEIQDKEGYWQSIIHALQIGVFMSNSSAANEIMNSWWQGAKSIGSNSSSFIKIY